jgi:hypothetical protein
MAQRQLLTFEVPLPNDDDWPAVDPIRKHKSVEEENKNARKLKNEKLGGRVDKVVLQSRESRSATFQVPTSTSRRWIRTECNAVEHG